MGASSVTLIQADANPILAGLIKLASGTGIALNQSGNIITIDNTSPGVSTLAGLSDVDPGLAYTAGFVLQADGSKYFGGVLSHFDLSNIGVNTHAQIDTHIADMNNPHNTTAAQVGAVDLVSNESIGGIKTFNDVPIISGTPTNLTDAVNVQFVNNLLLGQQWRDPVEVPPLTTPPGSPPTGGRYIVLPTGTGAWAGHDNEIATWNGASYTFEVPVQGWTALVLSGGNPYNFNGTAWVPVPVGAMYTASNGILLNMLNFEIDLKPNDGLVLKSGQISVDYDDSSIGIVANKLAVKTSGITNAMLLGPVSIAKGGTGQITASAAFNALSPMTTLGDLIYGGASGSGTRLAGNTTTTKKFLRQTGTGTISAVPAWDTVTGSDVSGLTSGQVLFGGSTGLIAQDSNFTWNNTTKQLGLGAGAVSTPSLLLGTGTSKGFYAPSSSTVGLAINSTLYQQYSATLNNLFVQKKYPTTLWAKNSYLRLTGQGIGDIGITGMYDQNELGHAALRATVTVNITGAGTYTNTPTNLNRMFAYDAGNFFTISGVDNTTSKVEIIIQFPTNQPNYSDANWWPILQYRLGTWTTPTGNSATFFKKVTFEVSTLAAPTTWIKPAGGAWETTDFTTDAIVPSFWTGTRASPSPITSWANVRITLEDIQIDPGYGVNNQVWISQIGLRHLGAPWSRNYLQADGDTMWGNLTLNNTAVNGTVNILTLQSLGTTSSDRTTVLFNNGSGTTQARFATQNDGSFFRMNFLGNLRIGVGSSAFGTNDNLFLSNTGGIITGGIGAVSSAVKWFSVFSTTDISATSTALYGQHSAAFTANNSNIAVGTEGQVTVNPSAGVTLSGISRGLFGIATTIGAGTTNVLVGTLSSVVNSGTGTLGAGINFYSLAPVNSGGGLYNNFYGFYQPPVSAGSTAISFRGEIASGSGRWNTYNSGSAPNYFAGLMLFGGNAAIPVNVFTPQVEIQGTTDSTSTEALYRYSNDTSPPRYLFVKSRGASLGINSAVTAGTNLGQLQWLSADGSGYSTAAFIDAIAEAPISAGIVPSTLRFSTTDSAGNNVIGLTMNSLQRIGIGVNPGLTKLHVQDTIEQLRLSYDASNFLSVEAQSNGLINFDSTGTLPSFKFNKNTTIRSIVSGYLLNLISASNNPNYISMVQETSGVTHFTFGYTSNTAVMRLFNAVGTQQMEFLAGTGITLAGGQNFIFSNSVGTKIGSAANQLIGFWGATPVSQATTGSASATRVAGGGAALSANDTYDGYTIMQIVRTLRSIGLFA